MFKNAIAYRVPQGFRFDNSKLSTLTAMPCESTERKTAGFSAPCDHATDGLIHKLHSGAIVRIDGTVNRELSKKAELVCFETNERLLPGDVIDDELSIKIEEIETKEGVTVGKRIKKQLREEVILSLLPKAFIQKRRTFAALIKGVLIVDTSSPARAEAVISAASKASGHPVCLNIELKTPICRRMADWIVEEDGVPNGLTLDDFVILKQGTEDLPSITYKNQPVEINREEIAERITQHFYMPEKIGVTFNGCISFKITAQLHLKQLSLIAAEVEPSEHCEQSEVFDADMILMLDEIVSALEFIIEDAGGFEDDKPDLLNDQAEH